MNIALIGVGALGRRHLQSLVTLEDIAQIHAVEVNETAVEALKVEFPHVHFNTKADMLPKEIHTAVIATSSNVRRKVFDELVSHSAVKNIIFEKVLFQKVEDYYAVQNRLRELGISAWVNCARREWSAWKSLKEELKTSKELYFANIGGQWGLGCNAVHFLDLIEFLADSKVEKLDTSGLQPGIVESKRKGFCEFYGTITGSAGKCRNYVISCMDSVLPPRIEIISDQARYIVDEGNSHMMVSNPDTGWKWIEKEFPQVYQSQLTAGVVKSIIEKGTCNLTKYDASMETHLKLITPLLDFFRQNGMEGDRCPIT